MKPLVSVLAISLFTSSCAAAAADLPSYDVEGYCRQIATATATLSGPVVNACIERERQAFSRLQGEWTELPEAMRQYCLSLLPRIALSYVLLDTCIKKASNSAADSHR